MKSALLLLTALLSFGSTAFGQPTAFTYQGRLKNGSALATGPHDFRFRLWDSAAGGTQLGSIQCVDNLAVADGVFNATIDFGPQFANPAPRFLEIEVRADTGLGCSNAAGFVVLAPRQPITPVPVAMHARSAFSLASPDGSIPNAVFVDNGGKVGIGTTAPTHRVHISTNAPTLALQDLNNPILQTGYITLRDNANIERGWMGYGTVGDPDLSIVNARPAGDVILLPLAGNVGIGTTSPTVKLEVHGDIRLGPSGQFHAPAAEENLRMIRGSVSESGVRRVGSGFTCVHNSLGKYTITFGTGFAATPVVVVGGHPSQSGFSMTAWAQAVTPGSFEVLTLDNANFLTDRGFDFIAIGPR